MISNRINLKNLPFFILLTLQLSSCKSDTLNKNATSVQVLDDRLSLSLAVEDPTIVTPIGIAIDRYDRIYVLESHTHLPPKDYKGPKGDLIKIFEDTNGDGQLDKMTVFDEGIKEGMNLAFSPEGHLYMVSSKEVWAYHDLNGDGNYEEKTKIMGLVKPQSVYAHSALLSIAFSDDGYMYIGRGNMGGEHWILEGSDGGQASGYGDGGNILRSKWDGSQVEIYSTGYWNPFDLKFDTYGRLLVADNDPDSRGPNRLVHAVYKSDFGYQSIFGSSGIHPYLSWNGELPGTLPIAAALGEAPSGLINANLTNLPEDFQNQMLCTIWEESSIVGVNLEKNGLSVRGDTKVLIKGGDDFRPVAFAVNSKGEIYFTDWVIRYYPNHGRGKIWKLSSKNPKLTKRYKSPKNKTWEEYLIDLNSAPIAALTSTLKSKDAFERHAGIIALSEKTEEIRKFASHSDTDLRMASLLAAKASGDRKLEPLAKIFLTDPNLQIRKMALIWIGSSQLDIYKNNIQDALTIGVPTNDLFEVYLETVKLLQPEFVQSYKDRLESNARGIQRELPDEIVANIVLDKKNPLETRVFALRFLKNPNEHTKLLSTFLSDEIPDELRVEALRTIQNISSNEITDKLLAISLNKSNSEFVRSEALASLSKQRIDNWKSIIPLLESDVENLKIEAARLLRYKTTQPEVREAFERSIKSVPSEEFKQQIQLGLGQDLPVRPLTTDKESWTRILEGKGSSERGRRVFYSNGSMCSNCHAMDGRGGDLGPDLSNVGISKTREQLMSSIVNPSAEMTPEWQGWYIERKDGAKIQGRQIDVSNNDIKLYTQTQGMISIAKEDILDYGMTKESLMPNGLAEHITDQDLRDLLAFLKEFK